MCQPLVNLANDYNYDYVLINHNNNNNNNNNYVFNFNNKLNSKNFERPDETRCIK